MSGIEEEKKEIFSEKYNTTCEDKMVLNFTLTKCQEDFYYKITIFNEEHSLGNFEKFETEEILCKKDNSEINFKKKLNCDYIFNKRQLFKICILKGIDINSSKIYKKSERITIFSSLITSPNSTYERFIRPENPDSETIIIKIDKDKSNDSKKLSIYDIIKCGIKLSCFISIDFSNEKNEIDNFFLEEEDNFSNIIKSILNIISIYTPNHLFNIYGIGGKMKFEDNLKKVFNINMNEIDASIKTYDAIIDNYNNCKNQVISDDKIYLSTLLNKINNEIRLLNENKNYYILFILIKGNIHEDDIKYALDSIIESSYLPLSIVIYNAGESFKEMNNIFNSIPGVSSMGMKKMRDNLLFLSLNDFDSDIEKMVEISLKEIVKQILFFYKLIGFTPENMKNSFCLLNNSVIINNNLINDHENLNNLEKKSKSSSDTYFLSSVMELNNKNENEGNENKQIEANIINIYQDNNSNTYNVYSKKIGYNSNNNNNNNYNKSNIPIQEPTIKYVNQKPIEYSINDNNDNNPKLNINNDNNKIHNNDIINSNNNNEQNENNNINRLFKQTSTFDPDNSFDDNKQKDNNINNIRIIEQSSFLDKKLNNNDNEQKDNNENNENNNIKLIQNFSIVNKNIKNNVSQKNLINNIKFIPQSSISDGIINNPYSNNNNNNTVNRTYKHSNTTVSPDKNKFKYNPYAEDYKKRNSGLTERNNNLVEMMNNKNDSLAEMMVNKNDSLAEMMVNKNDSLAEMMNNKNDSLAEMMNNKNDSLAEMMNNKNDSLAEMMTKKNDNSDELKIKQNDNSDELKIKKNSNSNGSYFSSTCFSENSKESKISKISH